MFPAHSLLSSSIPTVVQGLQFDFVLSPSLSLFVPSFHTHHQQACASEVLQFQEVLFPTKCQPGQNKFLYESLPRWVCREHSHLADRLVVGRRSPWPSPVGTWPVPSIVVRCWTGVDFTLSNWCCIVLHGLKFTLGKQRCVEASAQACYTQCNTGDAGCCYLPACSCEKLGLLLPKLPGTTSKYKG